MSIKKDAAARRGGNPIDVYVGQRVRAHRVKSGMSQSVLAGRLGISFQQVQKYERGTNRIGAGRLFDIAQFFEVPIETFFPNAAESSLKSVGSDTEFQAVLEFVSGIQGLNLCLSFLHIGDSETRRKIVALVQQLGSPE